MNHKDAMNDKVNQYINRQDEPKKTLLKELRALIMNEIPGWLDL